MSLFQTQNLEVQKQDDGIALLWLDVRGPDGQDRPYNVLNERVIKEFGEALDRVAADRQINSLVILSRKKTGFLAGADLEEFTPDMTADDAKARSALGQQLFDKVAALPQPTAAVIHGMCLGGGLELALACDYRVVVAQPETQIGFPEIELGIVPGWGGTQRMPRVVGLLRAFEVILQRRRLDAAKALAWGLADITAASQEDALRLIKDDFAKRMREQGKRPKDKLPSRGFRQRLLEGNPLGRWFIYRGVNRILARKVPEDMPAPKAALEAIQIGLAQGIAAGLAAEREAIGRLSQTPACRNMVTLFFLIEAARKGGLESGPASSENGEVASATNGEQEKAKKRRVGVVGAGTMGAGIAQLAALKGCDVVVQEINEAALGAGMERIKSLFAKAVESRLLSATEAKEKLARLGGTTSWQGFADVDIVIEAAIEDMAQKKIVFQELEKRVPAGAILATNTSSLSVTELQKGAVHPERVAGFHFFNPVHKMKLLEVVRAPETRANVILDLTHFAAELGKVPVVVRDSPGFIVNRILMPYVNEAGLLAAEGMPVQVVDQVMTRFGMIMGPLRMLDEVGLDVAAHIGSSVGSIFAARMSQQNALECMVSRGWLGKKAGKGFYIYGDKKPRVNEEALPAVREALGKSVPGGGYASRETARDRMVLLMLNEAAACFGEKLSDKAEVIDLAMVLGTGWAPHRGGPLRYTDDFGAARAVQRLEELARQYGDRFAPCEELRRRAQTKEPFYGPLSLQAVGLGA